MTIGSNSLITSVFKVASVLFLVLMTFAISTPANAFAEVHTVTFAENANGTDSVMAFETGNSPQSLTLLQNLSPSFTDVGYSFQGWNTSADGSGMTYADGSTYVFNADIDLYAQWIAIPVVHVVTFNENDSASDSVLASLSESSLTQLTNFASLQPTFTNPGYSFLGWNTTANGSGVSYANGSQYSFSSDLSLYAQWSLVAIVPVVHVVTFNENDSASDSVLASLSESSPTQLTNFASLQPTFTNPGYSFLGWNTTANGSGISYANGSQYSFSSDLSLYAQWSLVAIVPVVHVVTFNENDSASDSVLASLSESSPTQLTNFASLQPTFTNPGYSFLGWNTTANGSGVSYANGSQYSFSSDLSLYAQWSLVAIVPVVHVVTFNENDSASDSVNAYVSESVATPLIRFANLLPTFANTSRSFSGWNTSRDGSGTSYADGSQFSFKEDLVLYAQWTLAVTDTFSFNANGGDGTVASITGSPGSTFTVPGQAGLIRAGYVLTNWNTSANGSGSKYLVGAQVTIAGSTLLYAQWSGHKLSTLFGAIGTFKTNSSSLSAALKSQIDRVAHTIKTRQYRSVTLFGYTAATGLKSLNVAVSRSRAANVANYLRRQLNALRDRGVSISSAGEGAIAGQTSNAYSRVEVFGV